MKNFHKYNVIGVLVFTIIISMSIGYALYNQSLGLNGEISLKKQGKLEIISASIIENECNNLSEYSNPSIDGLNLSFRVVGNDKNFNATYLVEISNGSAYDYTFSDFPFNANVNTSDNVSLITVIIDPTTGNELDSGYILLAGERKTFKVQLTFESDNNNTEVNVDGGASFVIDKSGNMIASITPKTGNLQGSNTKACFTVSVANTYTYKRKFTLHSSNDNILLIDSNDSSLGTFSIDKNSTKDFQICAKVSPSSSFLSNSTSTIITLSSIGINTINVGELTLDVDIDVIATDKEIPKVGNVNISIPEDSTTSGSALISWDRIDTGGSSITNYYIILYNADTGSSSTYQTNSSLTSYNVSNLSAGNYYAKVYGVDEAGNIGESYCDSATTDSGYCSLSNTTSLKWEFVVTFSLTNLKHDNSTSTTDMAYLNQSYTTTLQLNTTSQWYSLPNSVTVTMGGNTLTSGSDYTYSSSSGKIVINKVTEDITITASASSGCLIKGTKIKLGDGNEKNIEDISYTDLLLVWNYETGSYTYEYPIWIEKVKKTNKYRKITFSDGSILKVFGEHGVFAKSLNSFISVNDEDNFKVGIKVAKLNDNNEIIYVNVNKIEIIYEDTEYYHVVSTRYYNVIANGFLTTDGTVMLSNLYQFGNNINWLNRDYDKLDLYSYDEFKDIMPYYMYKGLRVEEGKVLSKYLDLYTFKKYLLLNQLNENMILHPNTDNLGNRWWMVTTSDDDINSNNSYLRKENTYYILNEPKNKINFKYWYNTSDGKMYNPNDKVMVHFGMHFIAVYE